MVETSTDHYKGVQRIFPKCHTSGEKIGREHDFEEGVGATIGWSRKFSRKLYPGQEAGKKHDSKKKKCPGPLRILTPSSTTGRCMPQLGAREGPTSLCKVRTHLETVSGGPHF